MSADLFEASIEFPNSEAQRRLMQLVGVDDQKQRLEKGLRLLLDRQAIERWAGRFHGGRPPIVSYFQNRPPLFVLAGDVGTGKSVLAESIGDAVARAERLSVTTHRLSLSSRGSGLVGEMTTMISRAFREVAELARKAKAQEKARAGHILLVDEADALAQSRENAQMHHEDRAGVNALIRGINDFADAQLPAAVIMCTNRLDAIDPAIRRRAAELLVFNRPTLQLRLRLLTQSLDGMNFSGPQLEELAKITGERSGKAGYTFSDITQRLIPTLALDAYPDHPVRFERALAIAREMEPTPRFRSESEK